MYYKYTVTSYYKYKLITVVRSVVPYTVNSVTPNTVLHRAMGRETMNRAAHSTEPTPPTYRC